MKTRRHRKEKKKRKEEGRRLQESAYPCFIHAELSSVLVITTSVILAPGFSSLARFTASSMA